MAKTVRIDNSQALQALDAIIQKANQAAQAVAGIGGGVGMPGSNLSGTFTTAAAPGVNPASGSVGMVAGQAQIGVPTSVSAGAPSSSVFGVGFGMGSMGQVPGMGPGYFGGMGYGGAPPTVSAPSNSDYNWQAPYGAAPDQPGWGDDQQFGWVRGHFRRYPGQARGGGAGRSAAQAFSAATGPQGSSDNGPPDASGIGMATGGGAGDGGGAGGGWGGGPGAPGGGPSPWWSNFQNYQNFQNNQNWQGLNFQNYQSYNAQGASYDLSGASFAINYNMGGGRGQGQSSFSQYMGFRTYRELARGTADVVNDFTRYQISGEQNPLGFGVAAGNLIGGGIGAGLAAAGVGASTAGLVGLIAAPLISSGINALQAGDIQRQRVAMSFATYAGETGQSATTLAGNAAGIAEQYNRDIYVNQQQRAHMVGWERGGSPLDMLGNAVAGIGQYVGSYANAFQRRMGWYTGIDQQAPQSISAIEQAVGGAAMANGQILGPDELARASQPFIDQGMLGAAQAQNYGRAKSALPSAGGNLFSLALQTGIGPTLQMMRTDGKIPSYAQTAPIGLGGILDILAGNDDGAAFAKQVAGYQTAQYGLRGTAADIGSAAANSEAAVYSGRRTSERGGELRDLLAATDVDITARQGVRATLGRTAMGRASAEFRENERGIREDIRDKARAQTDFARGILSDVEAVGGADIAGSQSSVVQADLFGNGGDIALAGSALGRTLNQTAQSLRVASRDMRVPFQDRQRALQQAAVFDTQANQARTAGVDAGQRRTQLGQDVNVAVFGADISQAELYGSDADLGRVAGAAVSAQDFIAGDALRASNDPMASAEQRARDQVRSASARQQSLSLRSRSRDVLLSRISGRAAIAESDASNALIQSAFGDENDTARAGAGVIAALGSERSGIDAQIAAGGLTVDQELRLRSRRSAIEGDILRAGISTRDTVIGKVETSANLANQAAENELNRALKLGTGSDVRGAAGGMLQSLGSEFAKLQDQLGQGNLTFDQRAGLQRRMAEIQRQSFDIGQDAIDQGFAKDDMAGFGIASIQNSTARAIAQLMPFGGGNRLGAAVRTIRTDQEQLGVLQRREATLRQSGNLSPERAYQIAQQEGQLGVEIASGYSSLSEGMENYLPALSAGRGANFAMYDSMQLAALRVYKRGSNIRSYGSINGQQNTQQQQQWNALTEGMIPDGPHSLTAGINGGGGDTNALLAQILSTLQHMGGGATGSPQTIGETAGQAHGQLGQREVGHGYGGRKY